MYLWLCLNAGTGKSTLIAFIIAALNLNTETDVCYVSFTGKAATVLQSKGCANAITAHKLLYQAKPIPNGTYIFIPKLNLGDYKIIVVDEISMLPRKMWELLLSHHIHVLAVGDPQQLPPIDKDADNHVLDNPHIFLDEIMRQEKESEIIRLSMHIREGKPINTFKSEEKQVLIRPSQEVTGGMYLWADQILCATNEKRIKINNTVRQLKNFSSLPQVGDKIISLRNHWDESSAQGNWALTNGAIGTITNFQIRSTVVPKYIYPTKIDYMMTDMVLEDNDTFRNLPIDYQYFLSGTPTLDSKQVYQMNKSKICPDAPYEFAYAYAITTWKAQGSEWDKILLLEEGYPYEKELRKKFLYTAVTRAREKLVIVTK